MTPTSERPGRASIGLEMKENQELSASNVAFFNSRVELRVKVAYATRWGSVERESWIERQRGEWGGF